MRLRYPLDIGTAVAVAVVVAVAGFAVACSREQSTTAGPMNLSLQIDGETFVLSDGVAQNEGAPGSAAKNTVRVVGEPVAGDMNTDGRPDDALVVVNDPGGSGDFYYAVVAVGEADGYRATNVVPLGDRIVPQRIEFVDGRFIYEYLSRRPGEPLAATPTVPTRTTIEYDRQSGEIKQVR